MHPGTGSAERLLTLNEAVTRGFAPAFETAPGVFVGVAPSYLRLGFPTGAVLTVTIPPANLQVGSLKVPKEVVRGTPLAIQVQTRNVGTGQAQATTTQLWLSDDAAVSDDDVLLGEAPVAPLLPGKKQSATLDVSVPLVTPGTWYLIAHADGAQTQAESSEDDNARVKRVRLGPDLAVRSISSSLSTGPAGTPVTLTIGVANLGVESTLPTVTRIYLSSNGRLDSSDVVVAEVGLMGLAAKAVATQVVTVVPPSGKHSLIAVVDGTGTVAEADETNNAKKVSVRLTP